ncbi:hypothetical protein MRX96_047170 [Rhipicephalus microplus]
MKQAWLQVCTSVLIFQYFWTAADSFSHVCYMESPMKSPDALPFAKVDVDLCSHIIMGFATVGNDYSVDLNPIGGYEALTFFAELRKKRPSLKLMVSVGGGGGDTNFKEMTSTESNRQRFINSTAWALRTNNIDGLDLDWEFPELSDAANFVSLLEEASVELKRVPLHPLLLSAAVPAPVTLVINRYHIPDISKSVDFVNLMTYDLHVYQWYLPFVDHNSPPISESWRTSRAEHAQPGFKRQLVGRIRHAEIKNYGRNTNIRPFLGARKSF